MSIHAQAEAEKEHAKYYDRLIAVEVAFNNALHKLTFRNFESAPEWRKWYKENKKKKKW